VLTVVESMVSGYRLGNEKLAAAQAAHHPAADQSGTVS